MEARHACISHGQRDDCWLAGRLLHAVAFDYLTVRLSHPRDLATNGGRTMSEHAQSAEKSAVRELIARRAYELWEEHGRPHGSDLLHWCEAEAEIMTCLEDLDGPASKVRPLRGASTD